MESALQHWASSETYLISSETLKRKPAKSVFSEDPNVATRAEYADSTHHDGSNQILLF